MGAGFLGHRLRVARTFRGLDQGELGRRLGVGRALVGQFEAEARRPAPELVGRLAAELGFAEAFFELPFAVDVRAEECHAQRPRAPAHAALLAELVAWLDGQVQLPEENLPAGAEGDAEEAAAACRRMWDLAPDLPIPNLTRVVERAGVVVARARGAGAGALVGRRLLVVLDEGPGEAAARRFELARLAGHVVLHRGVDAGDASLAAEAERFAVALLLPRAGLLRELPRAPSLDWEALPRLAERWKVSLPALVSRAAELPVANAARYREAAGHLAGARVSQSADAPDDEAPEVLALALEQLTRGRRIGRLQVARRLGWSAAVLADVTGIEVGAEVVSLAAWRARRHGGPPARTGGAQLELDFGRER